MGLSWHYHGTIMGLSWDYDTVYNCGIYIIGLSWDSNRIFAHDLTTNNKDLSWKLVVCLKKHGITKDLMGYKHGDMNGDITNYIIPFFWDLWTCLVYPQFWLWTLVFAADEFLFSKWNIHYWIIIGNSLDCFILNHHREQSWFFGLPI